MTRYVDADKFVEWIEKQKRLSKIHTIMMLQETATADVVEVKHGYWISQEEAEKIDRYDLACCCSVCGRCDWDCTESDSFNYCPNCGAKMDERSDI